MYAHIPAGPENNVDMLLQVVLVSSKMGSIGDGRTGGNLYGYRMSKAAANCAGATLARDLKEDEIIVGLIHPGAVSHYHLVLSLCYMQTS